MALMKPTTKRGVEKMQRILSHMRKAIEEYKMIEEGDKIAVCLSGGKDSISMLHALKALQRFYPKNVARTIFIIKIYLHMFLQKQTI